MDQFFNRNPYTPPPAPVAAAERDADEEGEEVDDGPADVEADETADDDEDVDASWVVVCKDDLPPPPSAAVALTPVKAAPVASSAKHLARHHQAPVSTDETHLLNSFRQSRGVLSRAAAVGEPYNPYETEHRRAFTPKENWGRPPPRNDRHHPIAVFELVDPRENAGLFDAKPGAKAAVATVSMLDQTLVDDSLAVAPPASSLSKTFALGAPATMASAMHALFDDDVVVKDVPPPPPPTRTPAVVVAVSTPAPPTPAPRATTTTASTPPSQPPAAAAAAAAVPPTPAPEAAVKAAKRTIPTPRYVVRHASPTRPPASPSTKGSPALAAAREATFETRTLATNAKVARAAAHAAKEAKEAEKAKHGPPRNPPPNLLTRPHPHCVRSKQKMLTVVKEQGLMLVKVSERTRMGTAKTAAIAARKNMVERAGTRVRGDARPTKPRDHKPLAVAATAAAANAPVDAPVPAPTPFALHMGAVHAMLVSAVGADAIDRQVHKNKKVALSRTSFDFDGL